MNTVAIIQARMTSTRLPGKVLADVGGAPMLAQVIARARQAVTVDRVAVATTVNAADDPVARLCAHLEVPCIRGSEDDVLDRYRQAAQALKAEVVIRITADCPLLDPEVVDRVVNVFNAREYDYVANVLTCTYPDGLDAEVMARSALERAWQEARLKSEREHVTPYIRNHPEIFRQANVTHEEDLSALRWTVDDRRDLDFVRAVFARLDRKTFRLNDVLTLLRADPSLGQVNIGTVRNEGYQKSLREDAKLPEASTI